ncbi:MAG: trigger factor [Rickettsiales bacterium]|nr:trigger factor [Rickettsiales bacterium]
MQVEKIKEEKLSREFNITIPAANINEKVEEKIVAISKKVKMAGFREGKVPLDIVRKKYGKEALSEVLQDVVSASTNKTLTDNNLRPASQPSVEVTQFEEGKDLIYKLSLEVFPEVPSFSFEKVKARKVVAEISEKDINELQKLVANNSKDFAPLKEARKSKLGDLLIIDFKGFVDGKELEKGEASNFRVELGSGTLIKDFEDKLENQSANTEFRIKVKFPENYHNAEIANKDAEFDIKLNEILEPVTPEVNEEFAQKIGFENLEKFREALKKQLEFDGESMARLLAKKELFDALDKEYNFELPEKMLSTELHSIIHEIEREQESLPKEQRKSHDDLHKEYDALAKRRVKLGILITEIGRNEKVEITQEDLNKALQQEAYRFPGQEQKVIEFYQKNPQAFERLKGPIIEEKVVDVIFSKIKPTEEKIPLEKLRELILESGKNS